MWCHVTVVQTFPSCVTLIDWLTDLTVTLSSVPDKDPRGWNVVHCNYCTCLAEETIASFLGLWGGWLALSVFAIVANRIIGNTMRRRLVRVRNSRLKLPLNLTFVRSKSLEMLSPYTSLLRHFLALQNRFLQNHFKRNLVRSRFR